MRQHWQRRRFGGDRVVSVVMASQERSETEKVKEEGKMKTREEKSAREKSVREIEKRQKRKST
jgi:hypothetical protein